MRGDADKLAEIVRRVGTDAVAHRMVERFRVEIGAYRALPQEMVEGPIFEIARHNLELFFQTLAEGRAPRAGELAPFRRSARERATEGLPLEDLLHAYRLGGRLGWEALVDAAGRDEEAALLPGVARLMEYVDQVSDAVTAAYHDERQHLLSAEERRIYELFEALVSGRPLDVRARDTATQLGFPIADTYRAFAAAESGAAAHQNAQLAAALRSRGVLAVNESERIVGLLEADRARPGIVDGRLTAAIGQPAPRAVLASALDDVRLLLGVALRLGHRGEVTPLALLPELLLARSPHAAAALHERALGPLEAYGARRAPDLLATVEAFVECFLDRRRAAERLHVHPNTLDYRLRRIEGLTGLRLDRPDDLTLVMLALKQRRLAGNGHD